MAPIVGDKRPALQGTVDLGPHKRLVKSQPSRIICPSSMHIPCSMAIRSPPRFRAARRVKRTFCTVGRHRNKL